MTEPEAVVAESRRPTTKELLAYIIERSAERATYLRDYVEHSPNPDHYGFPDNLQRYDRLVAWLLANLTPIRRGKKVTLTGRFGNTDMAARDFFSSKKFSIEVQELTGGHIPWRSYIVGHDTLGYFTAGSFWEGETGGTSAARSIYRCLPESPALLRSDRFDVARTTHCEPYDREAVFERDSWTCRLCLLLISRGDEEVDHVVPIALGGADAFWNVQASHRGCNQRKGASPPSGRLIVIPA